METVGVRHGGVKHSLHILLHSLIDYAGLFPPAGLKMADAVANYARYKNGPNSWALGRFVVPAARLDEFEEYFIPERNLWHLSALIGQNATEDLARIADFNGRHRHSAVVDTLEAKVTDETGIRELKSQVPESILVYFEIPFAVDPRELIAAVGAAHARAKVRTGGLTPEMFPSEQQVLRFLEACIRSNVAFKATAGLHHPVRCFKPLTYEPDAPSGTMHGFLNVFIASAFLLDEMPVAELERLLLDDSPASFDFEEDAVTWNGHRLPQSRLLESRALASSFGSCSFEEPISDLVVLNLL
jgi:hypothetical protein